MQSTRHLPPDSRGLPVAALSVVLLTSVASGCRTAHVVTADTSGRPQYSELTVIYELVEQGTATADDSPQLDLEFAKSHPYRAALVSFQRSLAEAPRSSDLRLRIQYPHLSGTENVGLVTVEAPGDAEGEWRTMATRTLSRADVDLVFVHLANGGVCGNERRPHGTAQMTVEIDGHRTRKRWTREPRLDRLAVETCDACR